MEPFAVGAEFFQTHGSDEKNWVYRQEFPKNALMAFGEYNPDEYDYIDEELEDLRGKNKKLTEDVKELDIKIKKLTEENERLTTENTNLVVDVGMANIAYELCYLEKKKLNEVKESLIAKVNELELEKVRYLTTSAFVSRLMYQIKNKELEDRNKSLEIDLNKLELVKASAKDTIASLEDTIASLEDRNKSLEIDLTNKLELVKAKEKMKTETMESTDKPDENRKRKQAIEHEVSKKEQRIVVAPAESPLVTKHKLPKNSNRFKLFD